MTGFAKLAGAAAILLAAGSISANAACNGDTGTETALGAGSGALAIAAGSVLADALAQISACAGSPSH